MKLRNQISTLHGFIGILGGLLLVVMGLTGSAIVFHQEIDRALNPHLMRVVPQGKPVAIETFLPSAKAILPNARLESIQIPQTPDASYQLGFKSANETWHEVFVHPYTGEILGDRQSDRTLIGIIYAIHHDFLVGTPGLYLVGVSGVILMLQAITGLILWTGWRKLSSSFRIRWQAPNHLLSFDLHNIGGILTHLFLLIIGFTGVVIVGAHILLEPPATTAELPPPFQPTVALSDLLRNADAAIPNSTTISMSFPDAQQVVVSKKLPSDHPQFYFSSVRLDGKTGEVLEVNQVSAPPKIWQFLIPIAELHFGSFGGLPTRILYVFIGFMPLALWITGLVLWKRRRLKGKRGEALALAKQS